MAAEKYQHAEDEYFKLRGQFDTGRITQEQFDEKLRALMVQDEQGRYWMLGADSGKWYFYDGAKWVQGDPYPGAAVPPPAAVPVETRPVSSPSTVPPIPASVPPSSDKRGLPWAPIVIVLLLLLLGVGGFFVFQNRDRIFVAQQPPQITPILPPTITRAPSPTAQIVVPTNALPTLPPLPTAIPTVELPTVPLPTLAPTNAPTSPPAVTVIVVTSVPPTVEALPTFLPTATIPPTATSTNVPTSAPTNAPPTNTQAPPTKTALPTCPNGVCVTKLEYSPAAPKRNQEVTFTATFLNSTNDTKYYNWLVLMYRQGQTKGFGESPAIGISIPSGVSTFSITYVPVTGKGGGCESFYARAGWKVSAFEKYEFPNVSGEPATANMDVCP